MTTRCINAAKMKPMRGTIRKATQKLPVSSSVNQASTVPTIKKSPCAMLMMSSQPKIIERPRAIKAMIKPQMSPFSASNTSVSNMTRNDPWWGSLCLPHVSFCLSAIGRNSWLPWLSARERTRWPDCKKRIGFCEYYVRLAPRWLRRRRPMRQPTQIGGHLRWRVVGIFVRHLAAVDPKRAEAKRNRAHHVPAVRRHECHVLRCAFEIVCHQRINFGPWFEYPDGIDRKHGIVVAANAGTTYSPHDHTRASH